MLTGLLLIKKLVKIFSYFSVYIMLSPPRYPLTLAILGSNLSWAWGLWMVIEMSSEKNCHSLNQLEVLLLYENADLCECWFPWMEWEGVKTNVPSGKSGSVGILEFNILSLSISSPGINRCFTLSPSLPHHQELVVGLSGGPVVRNLPANAGVTGLIPVLGRSHVPWSN